MQEKGYSSSARNAELGAKPAYLPEVGVFKIRLAYVLEVAINEANVRLFQYNGTIVLS